MISIDSYRKDIRKFVHRLVAEMFIPNLDPSRTFIDHIDRDKQNYSLSNLRWVTTKENNSNKLFRKFVGDNIYEAYEDSEFKILKYTFSEEELYKSDYNKRKVKAVSIGYLKDDSKGKYKGLYWKVIDKNVKDYLKDGEIIEDSLWVLHYSKKFFVHPLGIIKSASRFSVISIGSQDGKYLIYNGNLRVHRLVAEVFLNGNKPIEKDLQVDHLDTNPHNNRVNNLRICTKIENMNNPITKEANCKKVLAEGVVYNSITECAKFYGVTRQCITYKINSKYQKDFSFL